MGEVLAKQGRVEEAIAAQQQAIHIDPDNLQPYHKLIELQPEQTDWYLQLGDALVAQTQFNQAIIIYQIALDRQPDSTLIQVKLAEVLRQLGDSLIEQNKPKKALSPYRHAVQLNPDLLESILRPLQNSYPQIYLELQHESTSPQAELIATGAISDAAMVGLAADSLASVEAVEGVLVPCSEESEMAIATYSEASKITSEELILESAEYLSAQTWIPLNRWVKSLFRQPWNKKPQ
ncbi:MAG: tetratricopeptide repeat protein [Leptolyngbyaceae cyanobacterium SL_5_14]|nr:tetratricopeptide repeat protein [Leptolyngbyaceae cyanobacterium SL_5_14]